MRAIASRTYLRETAFLLVPRILPARSCPKEIRTPELSVGTDRTLSSTMSSRVTHERSAVRSPGTYRLPQVVSPIPEPHRLVPSENVEQKNPERQSESAEQVPHSSVEAHEDKAPMSSAAQRARKRRRGGAVKNMMVGFWQA